jgi:4-hydroxyphenylpyruvate dioxygenase
MDLLYWSRHFRNMPGEGDLDLTSFTAAVLATGYSGPLSLEIFNDQFRGGNARLLAQDGRRSILNLLDRVRRVEPGLPSPLPAFPAPIRPQGVAWVEFASADSDAPGLSALLSSLGFAPVADHVRKQVTLWQQGQARIVVNTDADGFARTSWTVHGTGVCEIGLAVPDAAAALARAVALGAEPLEVPGAPGERAMPALRGAGGAVLRLVDASGLSAWAEEFRPRPHLDTPGTDTAPTGTAPTEAGITGAGITGIDHLALTLPYDEMLSWSLFHTALLEMDRAPMVDVIDPDGLVRSQALASPGGALRLTLNGADTRRTLAGEFLAESFGGAVQHIALTTDDIFATARALAALGFAALPMTRNYYADLAARFGLDAATVGALAELNLLYDADGRGGQFWQLYSRPFGGGMFVEIVQRTGGYDGYGAPNAPFRIAAQKRLMRHPGVPRR